MNITISDKDGELTKAAGAEVARYFGMTSAELTGYVAKFAIDALHEELQRCGQITLPLKFANLNAQRKPLTDAQKAELAGITGGKELLAFTDRLSKEGRAGK